MKSSTTKSVFFVGWDVGAWNCDKNGRSRDAIVILNESRSIVGKPWRGNLRESIISARQTNEWLKAVFAKCGEEYPAEPVSVTMAIDTPLGFPAEFVSLVTGAGWHDPHQISGRNRYLFRHTECYLFDQRLKPLSPIKDMIGSQATKGMHVIAKFAPHTESCGVWSDRRGFYAIETYPSACRSAGPIKKLLNGTGTLSHADLNDARVCALIAYLFANERETLDGPSRDVPEREGWIWTPML
jgi:hypothetical protein